MWQTLGEFLKSKFEFLGPAEKLPHRIAGVSIDTRKIRPNEIYFAIRGETLDGHDFVQEAFRKKAAAAVVERAWWKGQSLDSTGSRVLFLVDDAVTALQEAANDYRKRFSVSVIGLTGTNGKTTTKEMMAAVLSQIGAVCKTEGNLNNHIGLPLTLFTLKRHHQAAVVEMGANHFGEIARLCEVAEPQFGLITNVGRGHLEFLGDLQGVARAKMELFEYLQRDGTAFINLDDPLIVKNAPKIRNKITYGFKEEAKITAQRLPPDASGCPRMRIQGQLINLNVLGDHNLSNALAAAAVGLEFGVTLAAIKTAIEHVKLPAKRMETIKRGDVLIFNDSYNANPDSTLSALRIFKRTPCQGKRIFVFGDMLELGKAAEPEHAKIGAALGEYDVDLFFAYGPLSEYAVNAARSSHQQIASKHFQNKTELVAELKGCINDGDLLLIKGSRGMKMEEILDDLLKP